jgi:hypothetical protein
MNRAALLSLLLALSQAPAWADDAGPVMLAPGIISSDGNEFGGTMSPDGNEIYFSRSVPRSYMYAIYMSRKVDGRWREPELVPFSGHGRDFDPVMAPDGKRMVFVSDRPVTPGKPKLDYDIWMVERASDGRWGVPHNVGAPINTALPEHFEQDEGNEWFASLAADGTLYFATDGHEPKGRHQIHRSRLVNGRYQAPENLGPVINADPEDGEPIIAPNQSFLLFAANSAKDGYGDWDIYISHAQADGSWSKPENLGPLVNTPARDYSPRLMPDGHTLIFTSERHFAAKLDHALTFAELKAGLTGLTNGLGNIYQIDLRTLHLKTPVP